MKLADNRGALRVGIKQLHSIVKKGGDYELIEGTDKSIATTIKIVNISTGGFCIESKFSLMPGVTIDLEMPTVKTIEAAMIKCDVMRSVFREDPQYHINMGTNKDKSYYEIGLKFKLPNTEYLKQLYKLAVANQI